MRGPEGLDGPRGPRFPEGPDGPEGPRSPGGPRFPDSPEGPRFPEDTTELRTRPLGIAIATCLGFAVLGALLTGQMPEEWYAGLVRPELEAPVWLFLAVSVSYYFLFGVVLYRIQVHLPALPHGRRAFALALAVMALNEGWNAVFFGMRSPFLGFAAMLVLLGLLLALQAIFFRRERLSFWVLSPYLVWTAYDVVWSYRLWQLN